MRQAASRPPASLPSETVSSQPHLCADPLSRAAGGRAVSLQACSLPLTASGPAEPGQRRASLALCGWLPDGQGRPLLVLSTPPPPQTMSVQPARPPPAAPRPRDSVILRSRNFEAAAQPLGTLGPAGLEPLPRRVWADGCPCFKCVFGPSCTEDIKALS